jgi:RND superfamily putative drug exporter
MKLLGDWNWYLPSWLEWLPRFDAGEDEPQRDSKPAPVSA